MDAAVVEFDSLADAVGPAAENHHLAGLVRRRLVFHFVGRIQIRRQGFELGGTGIDAVEIRFDGEILAIVAHGKAILANQFGDVGVAEAILLELAQIRFVEIAQAQRLVQNRSVDRHQIAHLLHKPGIKMRLADDFFKGDAAGDKAGNLKQSLRGGHA